MTTQEVLQAIKETLVNGTEQKAIEILERYKNEQD